MINWELRTYSKEDFINAWKTSPSIRQCLIKLNIKPAGGNYHTVKKMADELGLTQEHMLGQAINRGKTIAPKKSIEEYLVENSHISSYALKIKLIKAGIFQEICSICKNTEWLDKPIPLELDHINGDHYDNRLKNLRLLCPNCHAQTENYRGKNKKKFKTFKNTGQSSNPKKATSCLDCDTKIPSKNKRCSSCHAIFQGRHIPSKEELIDQLHLNQWNLSKTGRHYQVSSTSIRKWCKKYIIEKP